MSLVCSVIFIHHAFNANILDKDYAFSDGEILMVDNAVRTHFEPYERHFKEIGFNENTIKKYLQCTNIQTVTMPVPAKFLRASNVPTGLLNEMIAYLNSEERNHHNFSELLLFSCLSIFAACKGFITLLTNGVLSVSGKVRNIVNMKLAHPWKLKDICDCLYISESLLKKKLKQEQTTFSQILLDARMQHAKNLIRVEGSVNKIAEQCGYASTSYFIYAFRKHFGNSPKRVSKDLHAAEFSAALLSEIAMHVTAKPSSFQCNLKCDYCFYLEKESQFTHEKWMDDSTLKEFIKQYIAASGNQVYFTWQGGEPTLAGLDFFRKVIHYQQRYAGQKRIFNALQTNGILLNNEWCSFLKEHEFLVGISIDGPQELHDRYRRSNSGNGTFAKVIAAIERLKSYQVEFNTLTVINNVNVHYPLEVYHFLKSIGSKHMQFIELLETGTPNIDFSGHSENTFRIIDFSVPPTAYGKFMSTIFMQWVKNDVGEIFIRQFESFVSRFLGNGHTSCIFQESCKDNLVVESNGDIYECDHFVYPQYKIGNINKSELKTMNSVQLTAQKKRISAKCQQCAYKPICNGGCPKHRITKVNNETVSYFCEGYKILFSTMVPYMNAMVELAKNRVPLYHIMDVAKQMENN